jgi:hypothetical protein
MKLFSKSQSKTTLTKLKVIETSPGFFEILEHPDPTSMWSYVRILREPYAGVVIMFGKVSVAEHENADGMLAFHYEYDIINSQRYKERKLRRDQQFKKLLMDIIVTIMLEYSVSKDDDALGTDDFKELDL